MADFGDFLAGELARAVYQPESAPYDLTDDDHEDIFQKLTVFREITRDFPTSLGIEVSRQEVEARHMTTNMAMTYGEIEFQALGEVFKAIDGKFGGLPSGKFYDLGSGTGKGVVAAALLHPFSQCVGIELLSELHKVSLRLKDVYEAHPSHPQTPVSFVQGDIFKTDWTDAAVVLVNSTCFYTEMLERISALEVQPGCIAISLTRQLSSLSWDLLQSAKHKMSWGSSTLHIHRKISPAEQQRRAQEITLALGS